MTDAKRGPATCAGDILNKKDCGVACVGGSLSVGTGSFTPCDKPWRVLFMEYLANEVGPRHDCEVREIRAAIGAMKSYGSVFTIPRNVIAHDPSLVFIEFCVNDCTSPDKDMTKKSVEGIVRQLLKAPTKPDICFLGAGCRPGWAPGESGLVDHSIHRAIADHYGLPFLDIQERLLGAVKERGGDWNFVAADEKDDLHLNQAGNDIWFECMREWFDAGLAAYDPERAGDGERELPPARYFDEFENPTLLTVKPGMEGLELDGSWELKGHDELEIPWHLNSVIVGRPGDTLTYRFRGRAIGTICHVYDNGLKVQAWIDGDEVAGPYTNYREAFGNFDMLRHGMEDTEHEIRLEVGQPRKRRNVVEDPQARVGYFAIA